MNCELMKVLGDHAAECSRLSRALQEDNRWDEARFEQIRSNVYNIFRAVVQTLMDKPEQLQRKLREIPAAWEESLRQAEAHGDADKATVERIKLEAVEEIRAELLKYLPEGA